MPTRIKAAKKRRKREGGAGGIKKKSRKQIGFFFASDKISEASKKRLAKELREGKVVPK